MRQLVTGVDADGCSCVVAEHVIEPSGDQLNAYAPFETASSPPLPRPPGKGDFMDLGVPVGIARFLVVQWPPGLQAQMHHTDTVDFDTVLEGSIDLILDDDRHHLEVGDSVVVTGVDHGWESGPSGATMSVVAIGTPSLSRP
jgi:hypothetical protein